MDIKVLKHMLIIDESVLKKDGNSIINIIKLKHPKTGTKTFCIYTSQHILYELIHYKEEFSSWFVDDSVVEDGSLQFSTAVDPLFYFIPCFEQNDKYCPLDNLTVNEEFPDTHHLLDCCSPEDLSNIADSKDCAGMQVYCFNKSKTLSWLKEKVQQVAHVLKEKKFNLSDGSSLLAPKSDKETEEMYSKFACQIVSDYIKDELAEELFELFGFKFMKQAENFIKGEENIEPEQKAKKHKGNESVSPIDDYSKLNSTPSQNKQKSKLTVAQKKLQKVDKSGMKNISSFFQKK